MWQVYAQADMTEGRGPMTPMAGHVFPTKQEAWDSINDFGGVMGRKPGVNCYPMDRLKAAGVTRWQDYEATVGFAGDYDVRPVEVPDDQLHLAGTLGARNVAVDEEALAQDLRDMLDELNAPDEATAVQDLRQMLVELED